FSFVQPGRPVLILPANGGHFKLGVLLMLQMPAEPHGERKNQRLPALVASYNCQIARETAIAPTVMALAAAFFSIAKSSEYGERISHTPSRILKISCPSSDFLQAEAKLNTISTAPSPQPFPVAALLSVYPISHGETTSQQPNRTFIQSCHRMDIT
ncbi:MAG: hypothetical protein WCA63_09475, partial [Gallionella sp.]